MPGPLLPLWLLMGAGGLLKSALVDAPRAKRERKLEAATQRYSPWTGMQADGKVQESDPLGSALSFGVTGAQMSSQMASQDTANDINKEYLKQLKSGQTRARPVSPYGLGAYPSAGGLADFGVNPYNF